MPTISGVTTHDGTDVVGLWTIAPVPQNTSVEDLPFNLEGPWSVYAPGHGIGGAIDLEPTSGDLLYWAEFISNDRLLTLGPYPFTLTTDRTWDDIIANPAPLPTGGGGGGGVSGSAAWFTFETDGSTNLAAKTRATFAVIDDGRATPRPDLIDVDGGDPTTLNVIEGGEYLISVTGSAVNVGGTIDTDGLVRLRSNVEVNGDDEAPAYYVELNSLFLASDTTALPANLAFQQTLEAGDTIQIANRIRLETAETADAQWQVASSTVAFTKMG